MTVMERDSVIATLRAIVPGLRARFRLASVVVFGSVARGEQEQSSDVDVLVASEPGFRYTLMTLASLRCELERELGVTVDIVVDHAELRPGLRRDRAGRDPCRLRTVGSRSMRSATCSERSIRYSSL